MRVFTQEGSVARRLSGGDSRSRRSTTSAWRANWCRMGLELLRHGLTLDAVKLLRAQVPASQQQLRFVLHESRPRQIQRRALVGPAGDRDQVRAYRQCIAGELPWDWRYLRPDERF